MEEGKYVFLPPCLNHSRKAQGQGENVKFVGGGWGCGVVEDYSKFKIPVIVPERIKKTPQSLLCCTVVRLGLRIRR